MSGFVATVIAGVLVVVIVSGVPWSIRRWRTTKQSIPWISVIGCTEAEWTANRAEYDRLYTEENQLRKRVARFFTR